MWHLVPGSFERGQKCLVWESSSSSDAPIRTDPGSSSSSWTGTRPSVLGTLVLEPWLSVGGLSALLHHVLVLSQWNTENPEMFHFYQLIHNRNVPDSFDLMESVLALLKWTLVFNLWKSHNRISTLKTTGVFSRKAKYQFSLLENWISKPFCNYPAELQPS